MHTFFIFEPAAMVPQRPVLALFLLFIPFLSFITRVLFLSFLLLFFPLPLSFSSLPLFPLLYFFSLSFFWWSRSSALPPPPRSLEWAMADRETRIIYADDNQKHIFRVPNYTISTSMDRSYLVLSRPSYPGPTRCGNFTQILAPRCRVS